MGAGYPRVRADGSPALAMVTGASSGIGQAYARRLASDGFALMIVARREERLEVLARELREECGAEVRPIAADLSKMDGIERVCDAIAGVELDLLVNDAGVAHYMAFHELPFERAEEIVMVNTLAPVMLSRSALPAMLSRSGGAIVNVASLLAFSGSIVSPQLPRRAVYASTKSFLVTFSQALAIEVAGSGVDVQVVCPGIVESEFHSRQGLDMSSVPRMAPDLVVQASLMDLSSHVVVCVPGLEQVKDVSALDEACLRMLAATRSTELASRYRS